MYIACLVGSIGAGKSTVAHELERLGATRVDLDQLSRAVLKPFSVCNEALAAAFGSDLLNQEGELNRALLAQRAFASAEKTELLESIELPAIAAELQRELSRLEQAQTAVVVVEVPVFRKLDALNLRYDELLCCMAPRATRRARAIAGGLSAESFDQRDALQATSAELESAHPTIFYNTADKNFLVQQVAQWWNQRFAAGRSRLWLQTPLARHPEAMPLAPPQ